MRKLAGEKAVAVLVGLTDDISILFHDFGSNSSEVSVLGLFSDDDIGVLPAGLPSLGKISSLLQFLREHREVTDVYCSLEKMSVDIADALLEYCEANDIRFSAVPARINSFQRRMMLRQVGYTMTLTPAPEPLQSLCGRFVKRTFDVVLSLLLLLTVMPVCVVVMFVLSKRKDRGPVLAMHQREGAGGRTFGEYSFRVADNHFVAVLPRVFNVFLGHMSFVGPREVVRAWVRPGITGLSQISVADGDCRDRVRTDIWYVENWSLWLDIRILIKRIFSIKQ